MPAFELVLILLAVAAALEVVAERLGLPPPALLVIGGAILAVLPGVPRPPINPELVFLVFVPPLLYVTAVRSSLRDFRQHVRSITLLSVGMVVATTLVVAVVARSVAPELTWAAALALGAIVSPPDAVAVTAVARRVGIPSRVVTVLEGEALFNDATALVAYRMAVAAALMGTFSASAAAGGFLVDAAGGVAIGLAGGVVLAPVLRAVSSLPAVAATLSLLTPFVVFIPAERLGVSGVLAVVTTGLFLGRRSAHQGTAMARVLSRSTWTVVGFLLEGMIFMLIGLELPRVLGALKDHPLRELLRASAAVTAAVILVRLVLVPLMALILAAPRRRRGVTRWREVMLVGWTGIRGGDSLVIALSLPLTAAGGVPFPGRDLILFVTVAVILATLVLQGLTLKPVVRALDLEHDDTEEREEADARRRLVAVREAQAVSGGAGGDDRARRLAMMAAERAELARLRDQDIIGEGVLRRVQRDLDLAEMLIESPGALDLMTPAPAGEKR